VRSYVPQSKKTKFPSRGSIFKQDKPLLSLCLDSLREAITEREEMTDRPCRCVLLADGGKDVTTNKKRILAAVMPDGLLQDFLADDSGILTLRGVKYKVFATYYMREFTHQCKESEFTSYFSSDGRSFDLVWHDEVREAEDRLKVAKKKSKRAAKKHQQRASLDAAEDQVENEEAKANGELRTQAKKRKEREKKKAQQQRRREKAMIESVNATPLDIAIDPNENNDNKGSCNYITITHLGHEKRLINVGDRLVTEKVLTNVETQRIPRFQPPNDQDRITEVLGTESSSSSAASSDAGNSGLDIMQVNKDNGVNVADLVRFASQNNQSIWILSPNGDGED
jgi:hypothetical protein